MTNRNYYQANKEKLKEQAKIRYSNKYIEEKEKSIIEIGIVISMRIKRIKEELM